MNIEIINCSGRWILAYEYERDICQAQSLCQAEATLNPTNVYDYNRCLFLVLFIRSEQRSDYAYVKGAVHSGIFECL